VPSNLYFQIKYKSDDTSSDLQYQRNLFFLNQMDNGCLHLVSNLINQITLIRFAKLHTGCGHLLVIRFTKFWYTGCGHLLVIRFTKFWYCKPDGGPIHKEIYTFKGNMKRTCGQCMNDTWWGFLVCTLRGGQEWEIQLDC